MSASPSTHDHDDHFDAMFHDDDQSLLDKPVVTGDWRAIIAAQREAAQQQNGNAAANNNAAELKFVWSSGDDLPRLHYMSQSVELHPLPSTPLGYFALGDDDVVSVPVDKLFDHLAADEAYPLLVLQWKGCSYSFPPRVFLLVMEASYAQQKKCEQSCRKWHNASLALITLAAAAAAVFKFAPQLIPFNKRK